MRITSKGQVTIPVEIREQAGLLPDTEVEFEYDGWVASPVLVDSNVLLDCATEDPKWQDWSEGTLAELADSAVLAIPAGGLPPGGDPVRRGVPRGQVPHPVPASRRNAGTRERGNAHCPTS